MLSRRQTLTLPVGPHSPRCPLPRAVPRRRSLIKARFEFTRSEAEWRAMLTDAQIRVMREGSTERPVQARWILPRRGRCLSFAAGGLDLPLYSSEVKYDSGHRLAQLLDVLPDAIGTMDYRVSSSPAPNAMPPLRQPCCLAYLRRRPAAHGGCGHCAPNGRVACVPPRT